MAGNEHDPRRPMDAVVLPFIFVPDGEPIPPEWLSRHRDMIQMRATFVPASASSVETGPQRPAGRQED